MASLKEEGSASVNKDLEHHHEAHNETDQSRQLLPIDITGKLPEY
jgi:hypothetical protein